MQYFEQSSLNFSLLNLKYSERLQYGLCFTAIPIPYWRRGYAWSFDTRSTMLIFDTIGINICIIATKRAKESAKYVASCNREVSSSQGARLALTSHAITKVVIDGEGNNWCTHLSKSLPDIWNHTLHDTSTFYCKIKITPFLRERCNIVLRLKSNIWVDDGLKSELCTKYDWRASTLVDGWAMRTQVKKFIIIASDWFTYVITRIETDH